MNECYVIEKVSSVVPLRIYLGIQYYLSSFSVKDVEKGGKIK